MPSNISFEQTDAFRISTLSALLPEFDRLLNLTGLVEARQLDFDKANAQRVRLEQAIDDEHNGFLSVEIEAVAAAKERAQVADEALAASLAHMQGACERLDQLEKGKLTSTDEEFVQVRWNRINDNMQRSPTLADRENGLT